MWVTSWKVRNFKAAEGLFRKALDGYRQQHGGLHADTLTAQHNLGSVLETLNPAEVFSMVLSARGMVLIDLVPSP